MKNSLSHFLLYLLGASLINYRPNPWSIGGLLAHELAHTLSVDHPWNLPYLCQDFPNIPFCKTSGSLPEICLCKGNTYPPQQCLMTFNFGAAKRNAPRFTPCDIQMMNYFSSNIACLLGNPSPLVFKKYLLCFLK